MSDDKIPADVFRAAYLKLKAAGATRHKTFCPGCGKKTLEVKMHPEAAANMAAAGYDGTCCWSGFEDLRSPEADE